jgi:hypothetical protein
MHVNTVAPGLGDNRDFDPVVPPARRLADAAGSDPGTEPTPDDFIGDWVRRTLREKMVAMIMGADEEESGIPPLDYEL